MLAELRAEAPTWAALLVCHALFAGLTLAAPGLPYGLGYSTLAIVIAFHSSLQHEAIHAHPTRWPGLNEALVFLPLNLAYPYRRYRDTHLSHHLDARLTDPYDDPESWYLDPEVWTRHPRWLKKLLVVNNAALGRMLIGPALGFTRFFAADARRAASGDMAVIGAWALHGAGLIPLVAWLGFAGVSPVGYVFAAYGGLSLINLRSFLEHRAEERVSGRSVIVEDRGLLSLLFLNNNLHAVHHAHPGIPWAALPAYYRAHRDRFVALNGGYVFRSYREVLVRHAFRPKEPAAHPMMDPRR